ncbi:hypothetical protein KSP39_PZI001284 [Platanthera zijinensis]|uniref:Integrase catalytic domain-containing protein n=1 Tax=Platanthera zijinensis TaxID=2320716 RepID=A0AAP0C266_9ASPA
MWNISRLRKVLSGRIPPEVEVLQLWRATSMAAYHEGLTRTALFNPSASHPTSLPVISCQISINLLATTLFAENKFPRLRKTLLRKSNKLPTAVHGIAAFCHRRPENPGAQNGPPLPAEFFAPWKISKEELRERVEKLGLAAVLAYGIFDGATYSTFFVLAFLGYEKSTGKNPAANLQALLGVEGDAMTPAAENISTSSAVHTPSTHDTIAINLESTLPTVKSIRQDVSIRLKSTNYLPWKTQVLPVLRSLGLVGFIDGSATRPDPDDLSPNAVQWHRLDQMVLAWLTNSLSEAAVTQIGTCATSAEVWHSLEVLYGTLTRSQILQLKTELQSMTKGALSMADYVQRVKSISQNLANAGKPIDEDDLVMWLLRGLGSEFDPIVAAINLSRDSPTVDEVTALLFDFELRLQTTRRDIVQPTAMYSARGRGRTHFGNRSVRGRGKFGDGQGGGRTSQNRAPPSPTTSRGGRGTPGQRLKGAPRTTDDSNVVCFRCGHPYHKANNCFAPDSVITNQVQSFAAINLSDQVDHAWYPDTGATNHMTADTAQLEGMTPYSGLDSVMVGNGTGLPITHVAKVSIPRTSVHLDRVLVVPNLKKNLLSVSQYTRDNDCCFIFYPWGFLIKNLKTGQTVLEGTRQGGLYPIHMGTSPSAVSLFTNKTDGDTWHARLGHPSFSLMKSLYPLLNISFSINKFFCRSCQMGKASKLPFTRRKSYSTQTLHTLHSDVWGPAPTSSIDGFRFYLIIVDECSRFSWYFPLRRKSEVGLLFIQFIKLMEKQLDKTVKFVQTDGGGEFMSHTLQEFFLSHGISHLVSCPGTPEQNGLAERKHRHIVETGLTLMAHGQTPKQFWNHAFSTAVYLINRLPTTTVNGRSPFEALFGTRPSYDHLRTFGCACFPALSPFGRGKLDFKTIECAFLGYSPHHKGYQCLDPVSGRFYLSRHVSFDETRFPLAQPSSAQGPSDLDSSSSKYFSVQPIHKLLQVTNVDTSAPTPGASPSPSRSPTVTRPLQHDCELAAPPARAPGSTALIDPALPVDPPPTPAAPATSAVSDDPPPAPGDGVSCSPSITPPPWPAHAAIRRPRSSRGGSGTTPVGALVPGSTSTHPMVTRSRVGTRRPKALYASRHPISLALLSMVSEHPPEPSTYRQAAADPNWVRAMEEEFAALRRNRTWSLVPFTPSMNVIGCKWVYKVKHKADGSIERYKARLVAQGFNQREGFDFTETFSPVVKSSTVRLVLSLAISRDWRLRQLDVKNAFLHGDLQEIVYLKQPPGFIDPTRPRHVCRLHKALYGLRQSPRAWYNRFATSLRQLGFIICPHDTSLFLWRHGADIILILLYVDDLIITGSHTDFISRDSPTVDEVTALLFDFLRFGTLWPNPFSFSLE